MKNKFKRTRFSALMAIALGALSGGTFAAVPANPYDYSRVVKWSYDALSRPASATYEPGLPEHCRTGTVQYDDFGNSAGGNMAPCAATPSDRAFPASQSVHNFGTAARTQTIVVEGTARSVSEPAGLALRSYTDEAGSVFRIKADVRFGIPIEVSTPTGATFTRTLDELGREVGRTYLDGTKSKTAYCLIAGDGRDLSTNSADCMMPEEAPVNAVAYVQTQRFNTAGNAMSAWSRVFYDSLDRPVRVSTTSFDGTTQPASYRAALVVQDLVYRPEGSLLLRTNPYFLATGSTSLTGSNDVGVSTQEVDAYGRVTAAYTADTEGSVTDLSFGSYGLRRASKTTYTYSSTSSTVTNDKGQKVTTEKNALGRVYRVTDAAGAQVSYRHDAFGNLLTVRDAFDNRIEQQFDVRGNPVVLKDPNRGVTNQTFDAADRLRTKSAALQTVPTTYDYDAAGRLVQRVEPEFSASWVYDNCLNGQGRLCSWTTSSGVTRLYGYDVAGRKIGERTDVTNGASYAWGWEYSNATGRLLKTVYPTGMAVNYSYTPLGMPANVTLGTALTPGQTPDGQPASNVSTAAGKVLWKARTLDAAGLMVSSVDGAGDIAASTYDAVTGRLLGKTVRGGTVMDLQYTWDSIGNMSSRTDNVGNGSGSVVESFVYGDSANPTTSVNRLTEYTVSGPGIAGGSRTVELRYNALGMLLHKSDVGDYRYGAQGASAVRPHSPLEIAGSILTYDNGGNVATASAAGYSAMKFNSFFMPDSSGGVTGANSAYSWLYAADHSRLREQRVTTSGENAGTRVQWYMNPDNRGGLGFEREENSPAVPTANNPAVSSNRHYITAFGRPVAAIVTTGTLPVYGSQLSPTAASALDAVKLEYWHTDHQGSLSVTTDGAGAVTGRYAYDPYGKRRHNSGAYDGANVLKTEWGQAAEGGTGRGFTGHEHLDDVGLVNMNGRLFDARTSLFVQADPIRGRPWNTQNYAAYGYGLNNPMRYLDPTGLDGEDGGGEDGGKEGDGDDTRSEDGGGGGGGIGGLPPPDIRSPLPSEQDDEGHTSVRVERFVGDDAAREGVDMRVHVTYHRGPGMWEKIGIADFINGWGFAYRGNMQSFSYKSGLFLRGLAHHAFDIPEDFSRASKGDYVWMASGFIPVGKFTKPIRLLADTKLVKEALEAFKPAAKLDATPPTFVDQLPVGTSLLQSKVDFSNTLFLGLNRPGANYVSLSAGLGGKIYSDVIPAPRIVNGSVEKFKHYCAACVEQHAAEGGSIVFLTRDFNFAAALDITADPTDYQRLYTSTTSAEFRAIYQNWAALKKSTVFVAEDGKVVAPPSVLQNR